MQVVVSSKLPATPARRTLLVFYQTVFPYLMERLRYANLLVNIVDCCSLPFKNYPFFEILEKSVKATPLHQSYNPFSKF